MSIKMIQSLSNLLTMVVTSSVVAGVLLFLPALIELRNPKDAGPRLIADSDTIASINRPINEIDFEGRSNSAPQNPDLSELLDVDG